MQVSLPHPAEGKCAVPQSWASLPRPHTEQKATPGLEIRTPEHLTTNTVSGDHSAWHSQCPLSPTVIKGVEKQSLGSALAGLAGPAPGSQGGRGEERTPVLARDRGKVPSPCDGSPSLPHTHCCLWVHLCEDPRAGEMKGWVLMGHHRIWVPFVGFIEGVICVWGWLVWTCTAEDVLLWSSPWTDFRDMILISITRSYSWDFRPSCGEVHTPCYLGWQMTRLDLSLGFILSPTSQLDALNSTELPHYRSSPSVSFGFETTFGII